MKVNPNTISGTLRSGNANKTSGNFKVKRIFSHKRRWPERYRELREKLGDSNIWTHCPIIFLYQLTTCRIGIELQESVSYQSIRLQIQNLVIENLSCRIAHLVQMVPRSRYHYQMVILFPYGWLLGVRCLISVRERAVCCTFRSESAIQRKFLQNCQGTLTQKLFAAGFQLESYGVSS